MILALGLLSTVSTQAHAQESDWFYMFFKDSVPLNLDTSRIALYDTDAATTSTKGLANGRVDELVAAGLARAPGAATEHITGDLGNGWALVDLTGTPSAGNETAVVELIQGIAEDPLSEDYAAPVFVDGDVTLIVLPQIQVRFAEDVTLAEISQELQAAGVGAILEADWVKPNTFIVEGGSRSGIDVLETANTLAARPNVLFADVDWRFIGERLVDVRVEYVPPPESLATLPTHLPVRGLPRLPSKAAPVCGAMAIWPPTDPLYRESWGLESALINIDIDATGAWSVCTGGSEVIVAVLDDGVQMDHPDLPNVISGADFTGDCASPPCIGQPQRPCDNHGTAVAGVIAAAANNGSGTLGVAPDVKILPIRFGYYIQSGSHCIGQFDQTSLAFGIVYAVDNGAKITNLSWNIFRDPSTSTLSFAYESAFNSGLIHFNSAGNINDSKAATPGNLPFVHAISGINSFGNLFFVNDGFASNYGVDTDFTSPGRSILTTDRSGSDGWEDSSGIFGADYVSITGTSFAAPHVAGVAALTYSMNPDLDPDHLFFVLKAASRDLGDPGRDDQFGHGLPSARDAVEIAPSVIFTNAFESGDLLKWDNGVGISF